MMLRIVRSAADVEEARELLAELDAEYVSRWGHGDREPLTSADLAPPDGDFFVAWLDDEPVGTGGWRRQDDVAEVKRMFVRPVARRQGVSRAVLTALESSAKGAGFRSAALVTGELQPEATALYRSCGYTDVAPFGIYADGPGATFLGKLLR